LARITGAGRY